MTVRLLHVDISESIEKRVNTGELGEAVVAAWLSERGAKILHRRWRWRRGEIDLIAIADADSELCDSDTLLFIEVKTRNTRNWDADGLLAITPQKQARLFSSAELFLVKHPALANYPCRFDVAIVRHQPSDRSTEGTYLHILTDPIANRSLLLLDYLPGAFDRS
jgi:putative endonuclease